MYIDLMFIVNNYLHLYLKLSHIRKTTTTTTTQQLLCKMKLVVLNPGCRMLFMHVFSVMCVIFQSNYINNKQRSGTNVIM